MTDPTPAADRREVSVSRRALTALGRLPGLVGGPLSPLARLAPVAEATQPADREAMAAILDGMTGLWAWAPPALLNPSLAVALLAGDGDTSVIGQYLWPDRRGERPGFQVFVGREAVRVSGPLAVADVEMACLNMVPLTGVAETAGARMTLGLEEFWAMLALLDAYRIAVLRRRLSRVGGYPAGVSAADLVAAWRAGLAQLDPGWAVSLFALLRPDLVPADFEGRVSSVVAGLDGSGLLAVLPGDPGDASGDVFVFGQGLEALFGSVMTGVVQVGLGAERLGAGNSVEFTSIGGWRTPDGFWLADLSEIPPRGAGQVTLALIGPHAFASMVGSVLTGSAAADPPEALAVVDAAAGQVAPAVLATRLRSA
jgi:hypothetical protein